MTSFRADGLPVPQGSMKVIQGRILHSQGSALAVWRSSIGYAAKLAGHTPQEGPMAISLDFVMPKPRTVKRSHPSVAPDLDKLIRSVLDSLTGIAYIDDSQVCEITASKAYGVNIGVEITLEKIIP
jgi:Holliday junction resolvase RusA-like endonuclease